MVIGLLPPARHRPSMDTSRSYRTEIRHTASAQAEKQSPVSLFPIHVIACRSGISITDIRAWTAAHASRQIMKTARVYAEQRQIQEHNIQDGLKSRRVKTGWNEVYLLRVLADITGQARWLQWPSPPPRGHHENLAGSHPTGGSRPSGNLPLPAGYLSFRGEKVLR
jgi:hypothetical protein